MLLEELAFVTLPNPPDLENIRSLLLRWSSMPTMHRGVPDRNEVEGEPS